jgi:dTMP kinase
VDNKHFSGGFFIAFEGIDGAGKSSLIKMLHEKMSQHQIATNVTAEPTKNYLGKHIREILSGDREGDEKTIAALFLADRVDHLTNPGYGMLAQLGKGETVISDRYYLSSYAYHVPHVTLDWVIEANSICAALRRPDLTFFIDISVEESLRRLNASREKLDKFENERRITEVRQNYYAAIEKVKADENIVIIDGERASSEVFEEVWHAVSEWMQNHSC